MFEIPSAPLAQGPGAGKFSRFQSRFSIPYLTKERKKSHKIVRFSQCFSPCSQCSQMREKYKKEHRPFVDLCSYKRSIYFLLKIDMISTKSLSSTIGLLSAAGDCSFGAA